MGVLDKLLLPVSGVPLIELTVASVEESVEKIVVAVSPRRADEVRAILGQRATVVVNPRPQDGMGSSIAAGVRTAGKADGYMLLPGDMPLVKPETVAKIAAWFLAVPNQIAVPVLDGRQGHPVVFPAWAQVALGSLSGDEGARSVIESNRDRVTWVDVGDSGIWRDIDVPDDYHSLVASL